MATNLLSVPFGQYNVSDKRLVVTNNGVNPMSATAKAASADIVALETRLTAINATLYSAANLQLMGYNDKLYALHLLDDPTGIS
jgi:hypothetical protein